MAAINFPNSPTQGDTFTANDKTWVYLDGKWAFQTGETPLPVSVASPTSGQFLKWNGTAWVNDTIDLGADTAGSFVASLVAGTGVTLANNSGEASTPTVAIGQAVATNSNVTFNDVTVSGNLTVSGTTTSINTETLTVNDNLIVLNNNATGAPTENAGIEIERGSSTNVAFRWNETSDKWELTNDGSTYADIATETYAASLTPATLDAIGDVNITSASVGQTIQWNGSAWVNTTPTGTTVTTTANRSTDIPSPFIGQLIVLTDTKKVQLWDGTAWLNITMAPPETPTSLSAIEAPTSVAISFTAGSANGSAITNYKYALSTDGGSTYGSFIALNPVDSTTPITVSGLSMNTTYHVKLKAVNDLGDSAASAAVSFTTEGVPAAPTSLSASSITGSTAAIAFTAGAANGASITNYKFAVSTDNVTYGAYTALDPADASTPVTVTGLTAGTLQYIKLKAVNSNGDSAASAAVSLTTLSTPSAPTSLSAGSITETTVDISFTPGDQGGSAITNYQYALSTDSGSTYSSFTALNPADATSPITISGLSGGTTYYVKLKAVSSIGAGTESSAISFNTSFLADFLIVAGGGTGGSQGGDCLPAGGGPGGGVRSTVTANGGGAALDTALALNTGTTYTVTVGAGAIGGGNGTDSSFGGITALKNASTAGGLGGFGQYTPNFASAPVAGRGYSGGYQADYIDGQCGQLGISCVTSGGGGGAGGPGGNSSVYGNGGVGGVGVAVSITGSSVYYGGGGGGSNGCYGGAGAGGQGGGGAGGGGGSGFNQAASGTANTGGGGGGGSKANQNNGGSGIVIIRTSSSVPVATTTGSPTVTTYSSYRVYSFTGSGSITF